MEATCSFQATSKIPNHLLELGLNFDPATLTLYFTKNSRVLTRPVGFSQSSTSCLGCSLNQPAWDEHKSQENGIGRKKYKYMDIAWR